MSHPVEELMRKLRAAAPAATDELTTGVYDKLHRIAMRRLRAERSNHTLQATALVNEAYLKLFDGGERRFTDEAHFLALASRAMRQVLVDYARARGSRKRSGGAGGNVTWTANLEVPNDDGLDLLELIELDGAIQALAVEDESLARLIEMRYFGGMTAEEIAGAVGRSAHAVRHDLRYAQAWLKRKLAR